MRPCGGCGTMVESAGECIIEVGTRITHVCHPQSPCCGVALYPEHDRTDYAACNECGLVYSLAVVKRNNRQKASPVQTVEGGSE